VTSVPAVGSSRCLRRDRIRSQALVLSDRSRIRKQSRVGHVVSARITSLASGVEMLARSPKQVFACCPQIRSLICIDSVLPPPCVWAWAGEYLGSDAAGVR
jgi:hypothetical protein